MSEHTPGPWKYQRDGRSSDMRNKPGWNPDDPTQCGHNVYGASSLIVNLEYYLPPHEIKSEKEVIANARLIAAAPDLLEACLRLVDVIEQLIPEQSARGVADVVLAQARAAIAKATP